MPGACEPWPGKRNAVGGVKEDYKALLATRLGFTRSQRREAGNKERKKIYRGGAEHAEEDAEKNEFTRPRGILMPGRREKSKAKT